MSERWIDIRAQSFGSGLLGATGATAQEAKNARLNLIERRIIRIEMALRRAGIEVEALDLPS